MSVARPRYGMPAALLRHGFVFVMALASILILDLSLGLSIADQPLTWLAAALVIGVVAAVIARGPMGAVFLVAGLLLGVVVLAAVQYVSTADAGPALFDNGWLYAALIGAALGAYFVVLLILLRLRRT